MTRDKVSISLPAHLLERLEKRRRKMKRTRSEAIQLAIQQWLRSLELDEASATYIAGYLRVPEDEAQALLQAQVRGLHPEDWA